MSFGAMGLPCHGKPAIAYTIAVDGVAAVVSEFGARERILPIRKNLEPHRLVIGKVMEAQIILPMAFGHVAKSDKDVTRALKRHHDAILDELERLDGMAEVTLKGKWDVPNIFEYMLKQDPELTAFRDRLYRGKHVPNHAEKIELGRHFEQRLVQERQAHVQRVLDFVQEGALDVSENPVKTEKMVMDLAFLVKSSEVKSFGERVQEVAKQFPDEFSFAYNGPWAPFSFVQLDLHAAMR